ncbi:putative brucei -specific protein [Rosellinia necatrix]|uniref:Putative brucei-specific protein n=1 Tax=Rosellinia necatrix TaxID=77044 RepID=A0A1W2TDS9_ROSNE|nr:putative brucei -specific protein [Rosellinia necatrix]
MRALPILSGLVAATSASQALHYAVPSSFKAAASNCTLPAVYVVTDFTTYTDKEDDNLNTVSFEFSDPDTKINTTCQRNSTSSPGGPSKNRYTCNNDNVAFIYQTTGVAGLTVAERACPNENTRFEASGLITPELDCADSAAGTLCQAKLKSLRGNFSSLQPIPPKAPTRRDRLVWRG